MPLSNIGRSVQLGVLALLAYLIRLNASREWWPFGKYFLVPLTVMGLASLLLTASFRSLVTRLLDVVTLRRHASGNDLWLVGFTYFYTVEVFGIIFLASQVLCGPNIFLIQGRPCEIGLTDSFYLSGVTITSVGYGDVTPAHWFTKISVVVESLLGLGMTAVVAGLFIGSLLSRQEIDRRARWFGGLQRNYLEALDNFPNAILSSKELSGDDYITAQRQLLSTIATLVKGQYEPLPSAKVTANWMQLYIGAEAPEGVIGLAQAYTDPLLRTDRGMRTLWGILVMREWDDKPERMPGPDEFALPVYDPNDPNQSKRQLSGAPEAVGCEDGCVVVSNTNDIDLTNQDESVREALRMYFQQRAPDIRSFASVRVEYGGRVLGVINIQLNETELCGSSRETQRIIVDMVKPFARYLGQLVVNWNKTKDV